MRVKRWVVDIKRIKITIVRLYWILRALTKVKLSLVKLQLDVTFEPKVQLHSKLVNILVQYKEIEVQFSHLLNS